MAEILDQIAFRANPTGLRDNYTSVTNTFKIMVSAMVPEVLHEVTGVTVLSVPTIVFANQKSFCQSINKFSSFLEISVGTSILDKANSFYPELAFIG